MASLAHAKYSSQPYLMGTPATRVEPFKRIVASVRHTYQRWAAARRQAAEDRMFLELALTDPRLMSDLRAIEAHAEAR